MEKTSPFPPPTRYERLIDEINDIRDEFRERLNLYGQLRPHLAAIIEQERHDYTRRLSAAFVLDEERGIISRPIKWITVKPCRADWTLEEIETYLEELRERVMSIWREYNQVGTYILDNGKVTDMDVKRWRRLLIVYDVLQDKALNHPEWKKQDIIDELIEKGAYSEEIENNREKLGNDVKALDQVLAMIKADTFPHPAR
jgi:hypothetical protein